MLILSMGLLLSGSLLMYSGLKKGDYWKKPWQPVVDLFGQSQLQGLLAGQPVPGGADTFGQGTSPGPTLQGFGPPGPGGLQPGAGQGSVSGLTGFP